MTRFLHEEGLAGQGRGRWRLVQRRNVIDVHKIMNVRENVPVTGDGFVQGPSFSSMFI